MTTITLTKELIKKQVEILRQNLTEKLSQSTAYHLLSKIYGYENWNTLSAILKNKNLGD